MPIRTITPQELHHLAGEGSSTAILDVRTPAEFARVHAAGACLMPLDRLDVRAAEAALRNPNGRIYVICQSGTRSAMACQRFAEAGIGDAYSVAGGTAAWEKLGLPVVRGSGHVIPLERQVRIVAGSLVLLGCLLAWLVQPEFIALSAVVGAGLVFAGITDICGMALLLGKMPWNQS